MAACFDKNNEQRNLQYECILGDWRKEKCVISDDVLDAAEEAKRIRTLTQQTIMNKQQKEEQFLRLTQERALALQKQMKIKEMNKNKSPKKNKIIEKKLTSFEIARNKAIMTKGFLQSRISSP